MWDYRADFSKEDRALQSLAYKYRSSMCIGIIIRSILWQYFLCSTCYLYAIDILYLFYIVYILDILYIFYILYTLDILYMF